MSDLDLGEIRKIIDRVDDQLVEAFEERMNTVLKVAAYKHEHNLPVKDRARELKVIEKTVARLKNPQYAKAMEALMEKIMSLACELEDEILFHKQAEAAGAEAVRIGYQGINGSYGHQALEEFFADLPQKMEINYTHFQDVFKAVKNGEVKYGVLPIENSSTGGITQVYDMIRSFDCSIVGEKCLKIEQNLLALPGATLKNITQVYSHPQGFEQSREFFDQQPQMKLIPFFNTAQSAKMVSESGNLTMAAVASKQAAALYHLNILAANINSNAANSTRFIIIANAPEQRPGANKITLVLSVKHEPGSLYKTLGAFSDCGLNMMNLESRPIVGKSWEYFFHIDLMGNLQDPKVKEAVEKVSKSCAYCKILGNYVADQG